MQTTLLFVPGWQNSGVNHWQTLWHIRAQAEFGSAFAHRVAQRDWLHPTRAEWVAALSAHILQLAHPVVIVAHSLGCITTAHLPVAAQARIAGAWLVAPADVERPGAPDVLTDFAPIPLSPMPYPTRVVASDNDPFAELARAQGFARAWGSECQVLRQAGHINTEGGYGVWDQGWEQLLDWIKRFAS